jgi:CO/xanthine dehydrogenase FAD-binding subunit
MKPAPFDYHDPDSVEEVVDLLAERGDDAVVLAGGQSLVPLLNLRLARPAVVVDLRRLPLEAPTIDGDVVRVGATVTITSLLAAPAVGRLGAGVGEALRAIGHPQIRNRGTIGGSLAHADPATELPAVLVALDGAVTLQSRSGVRQVGAADLFEGPFSTTRRPDELLTSVTLPISHGRSTTMEVVRRPGDFALVGTFVATSPGRVRIAAFGVADRPVRLPDAEAAAEAGVSPNEVAALVRDMLDVRDDVHATGAYRRHVTGTLVARSLARLAA